MNNRGTVIWEILPWMQEKLALPTASDRIIVFTPLLEILVLEKINQPCILANH
jgi:hypothetical protein